MVLYLHLSITVIDANNSNCIKFVTNYNRQGCKDDISHPGLTQTGISIKSDLRILSLFIASR